MKCIILLLGLISVTNAFASAQDLYNAIDVEAEVLAAPRTELKLQKKVGGLTCIKTNHIVSGDKYKCEIDFAALDSSAIYNVLNVEEEPLPALRIQLKYKKESGSLSCVKVNDIRSGDSFTCVLNF